MGGSAGRQTEIRLSLGKIEGRDRDTERHRNIDRERHRADNKNPKQSRVAQRVWYKNKSMTLIGTFNEVTND